MGRCALTTLCFAVRCHIGYVWIGGRGWSGEAWSGKGSCSTVWFVKIGMEHNGRTWSMIHSISLFNPNNLPPNLGALDGTKLLNYKMNILSMKTIT